MDYFKLFEDFTFEEDGIPPKQWFIKYLNELDIEYNDLLPIGEGGYGYTVDLGNNSIIKITSDLVELKYANQLKDISSPNLVKVYDVIILKGKHPLDNYNLIHLEKLNTNISKSIIYFCNYLHIQNPIVQALNSDRHVSEELVLDFFRGKLLSLNDEQILLLYNKWLNIWNDCKKYNLPTEELHGKNIGIRNGIQEIVYFDISSQYEIDPYIGDIKTISL